MHYPAMLPADMDGGREQMFLRSRRLSLLYDVNFAAFSLLFRVLSFFCDVNADFTECRRCYLKGAVGLRKSGSAAKGSRHGYRQLRLSSVRGLQ